MKNNRNGINSSESESERSDLKIRFRKQGLEKQSQTTMDWLNEIRINFDLLKVSMIIK
jgi:hypothetical protein